MNKHAYTHTHTMFTHALCHTQSITHLWQCNTNKGVSTDTHKHRHTHTHTYKHTKVREHGQDGAQVRHVYTGLSHTHTHTHTNTHTHIVVQLAKQQVTSKFAA